MVAMLMGVQHVQAVQRGAAAVAVQHRVDIAARQARTRLERELHEMAVAALSRFNRADVERRACLALNARVVQRRAVLDEHFGHGVREIRHVGEADVALDDRRVGVPFHHNQVTQRQHQPRTRRIDDMQQMHRGVAHHLLCDVDQCAFAGMRRVERRESITVGRDGLTHKFLQQFRLVLRGAGQIHHADTVRQRLQRRERWRKAPVVKHQQWGLGVEDVRRQDGALRRRRGRTIGRCHERSVGDRAHARVMPVFVARRRIAQSRECFGALLP